MDVCLRCSEYKDPCQRPLRMPAARFDRAPPEAVVGCNQTLNWHHPHPTLEVVVGFHQALDYRCQQLEALLGFRVVLIVAVVSAVHQVAPVVILFAAVAAAAAANLGLQTGSP